MKIIAMALCLVACPAHAAKSQHSTKAVKHDVAKEIYKAYLQAKDLSPKIQSQILDNKDLADRLAVYDNRKKIGVRKMIEESSGPVKSSDIEYLMQHFDDFVIDWNEGLFCSPNEAKFLTAIEKFKPSEDSWVIRKDYLETFKDLNMPWCEDCMGHNFVALLEALKETRTRYKTAKQREHLAKWVNGVVSQIEKEIANYKKTDDTSLSKVRLSRVATAKNWINQLREIAKS